MNYSKRVIAFIDILGFKKMIQETTDSHGQDNPEKIDEVYNCYKIIENVLDVGDTVELGIDKIERGDKRISIFSDTIVISFNLKTEGEIFYTLLNLQLLIINFIDKGILCRGAVGFGKLIHDENIIFGPALVSTHLLESKAALYPRIILDRKIIELATRHQDEINAQEDQEYIMNELLSKDTDGMFYVDYFAKTMAEFDEPIIGFPKYVKKLADVIRSGMRGSSHFSKADLRIKFSWMKEKYNSMINDIRQGNFIEEVEQRHGSEIADVYRDLNIIGK